MSKWTYRAAQSVEPALSLIRTLSLENDLNTHYMSHT